jgi:hypothetical protein
MPPTARGALLVGVLVIAGIVGLQILDDSGASNEKLGTGTGTDTTATASVDSTATSGTAVRPTNEVRVKVYNASNVDHQGAVLNDKLKAANWAVQEPATLTPARTGTTVSCVAGFENEATALATAVGQGATVAPYPSSPPQGASDADCIVILGKT